MLPYESHFRLKVYAGVICYRFLYFFDQHLDIFCTSLLIIDDEVGMLHGYQCASKTQAFQTCCFDQARGVVVGRVPEDRPGT